MLISDFPHCCGINVIANWHGPKIEVEKEIKDIIKYIPTEESAGMYLVALNNIQISRYKNILKKYKFKLLRKRTNPVHNNQSLISLYVYNHPDSKASISKKQAVKAF